MQAKGSTALSQDTKQASIAQFLGFGLDAYDMSLILVMAPLLSKLFAPAKGDPAWEFIEIVFLYSITMAARPIGSAFFGHYADKIGRKMLLLLTMSGVGVLSVVSAFLPTNDSVGVWAYASFAVIRFLMGCFFGGEAAVGHTFAIEHAPAGQRGKIGGFVQSGFPAGYVAAALVFALFNRLLGDAAMLDYGWRICLATGILPVLAAFTLAKKLKESPEFEKAKKTGTVSKTPFKSLFQPPSCWVFLQVFFFMTGLFLTDYAVYGFLPKILSGKNGFDSTTYALIYGFALFMAFLGYNAYGRLSDKIGRKKLTLYYCVFLVAFGVPSYYVLHNAAVAKDIPMAIVGATMASMLKLAWGIIPAYLSERFPTKHRAIGVGLGYSSGALLGGAGISLFVWWAHSIPFIKGIEGNDLWLSPSVILTVGAIMTFVSLLFSPETRDVNLSKVEEEEHKTVLAAEKA